MLLVSVAEPAKAWLVPLATVTLPDGVVMEAVTVLPVLAAPPVSQSVALRWKILLLLEW